MITVARETEFDMLGFIFVMLAAVMSGFRWSMTQILLQVQLVFYDEDGTTSNDFIYLTHLYF